MTHSTANTTVQPLRRSARLRSQQSYVMSSASSDESSDSEHVAVSSSASESEDEYLQNKRTTMQTTPRRRQSTTRLEQRTPRTTSKRTNSLTTPRSERGRKLLTRVNSRNVTPQTVRVQPATTSRPLPERVTPRRPRRDVYEEARERLHAAAVPSSLPGREDEALEIEARLEAAIWERTGCCLYISGVPGTGKTATVHECIRRLRAKVDRKELEDFTFVEINGMKITDPIQAYAILWEALTQQRVTPKHANDLLEKRFSSAWPDNEPSCVVLMDELDWLVTKRQTVMYNFFDWPNRPRARLIVIAVANTMDLPERALSNKVSSRLGLSRINFAPYTHEQLCVIVESRLAGCDAFDPDAVELCARKVSAVSGDARRALDICRLAIEMVEREQASMNSSATTSTTRSDQRQITVDIISRAIREMYASGPVAFVRDASLHQKMFLACVVQRLRKSGLSDVTLAEVIPAHQQLCRLRQMEPPTASELAAVCASLGASRCLLVEPARLDLHQRIRLNVGVEDVMMALRGDALFDQLL